VKRNCFPIYTNKWIQKENLRGNVLRIFEGIDVSNSREKLRRECKKEKVRNGNMVSLLIIMMMRKFRRQYLYSEMTLNLQRICG